MFTIQWIIVVLVFYVLSWLWLISTNQFVLCLDLNILKQLCEMKEPSGKLIINDLTMVLGSTSQVIILLNYLIILLFILNK
uniref:Uncharacterized protein n=1 Tax=Populus trichocarpa TaxID=3694 RepID=B9N1D4_POPTR